MGARKLPISIFVPPDALLSQTGVVAEGPLNEPKWVTGTIDFARLRKLRSAGEMRNYADWASQPGAQPLAGRVEIVQLS